MKTAIIEYKYYEEQDQDKEICFDISKQFDAKRIIITNHSKNIFNQNGTIFLNHTNQGKDIGAKLIGIDYLLSVKEEIDTLILLHDKKSPHSPLGNFWYNDLVRIFKSPFVEVLKKQMLNEDVGICCSAKYIKSEYNSLINDFDSPNAAILKGLMQHYHLNPPKPYLFVAGTIMCCKWEPLRIFFSKYDPLTIREKLEKGNVQDSVSGSITHSWERFFSWIITAQGYSIKGL